MIPRTATGSDIALLARARRAGLFCLAGLVACWAIPASAGNIFDDDWTPPKPVVRPHPADAPPPAVVETPAPATPKPESEPTPRTPPTPAPDAPAPDAPAPEKPAARRPIPGAAEQAHSRDLLKAAFANQLKDKSAAGRRKLAGALLAEVPKAADNPSDEFVMLGGAIEASKEAGSLHLCFEAADAMATDYDVDAPAIKLDAALKTNFRGDSPAASAENARSAIELIDVLLAADDFQLASKILSLARPAAAGDPEVAPMIQQRGKLIDSLRATHDRMAIVAEKLKSSPDDPGANLAYGSYLCFNKGQWESGLPMLAKGSDAKLKELAGLEIARPKSADEVTRLADGWWDAAAKQPEAVRGEVLWHAASFYETALDGATGLKKTLLERRIADASAALEKQRSNQPEAGGRVVRLLRLVDPDKDSVAGKFVIKNGELVQLEDGENRIEIPYHPPKEYDFRIEFTRSKTSGLVIQNLSKDGIPFIWVMQDNNYLFLYLKSGSELSNHTKVKGPGLLKAGVRYTSVVQVRRNGVKAFMNGQLIVDWKTDYKDVNPDVPYWALRDRSNLGIGVGGTDTVIHSADIVEVTGHGSKSR
jgi:hypothetical protein